MGRDTSGTAEGAVPHTDGTIACVLRADDEVSGAFAGDEEQRGNPRSRSAKLRVLEKLPASE